MIFLCLSTSAGAQLLHVSDPQSINITTNSADIQWTIANDSGQGATHVVFYWDDSMGGPGTWHPGHMQDGWWDPPIYHEGWWEAVWHEGWWENTTWHEGWWETVWHDGYWEDVWHEGYYVGVPHDSWCEDVWHEGYYAAIVHEGYWDGYAWHEGWTEYVWHEGYWEAVWHDPWTETIWHEGYYDQLWHDGYSEDVWHDGWWENTTWHEGYWDQVWHDGYTESIWHEGYMENGAWHDGYTEYINHDGWWENGTWHEGYYDQVWHDGYSESVWHDGWWENTWHDGYDEYIEHEGGYEDVWHEGYTEEVVHEGYWDDGEWHEGWTEYVWHDGYYQQVWHEGYTEQVWVDGQWESVWHDGYFEAIYHPEGYWDQVWHEGYLEFVWHEPYDEAGQWHPPYWVKGNWEGSGSILAALANNDPGNGDVTVSLPNLQTGHTYYYFVKSVITSSTDNPADPNNDDPDTTATAPSDGTFLQFTTLNNPFRFEVAPTVTEQTGTNVIVTFNFVNETGNSVHHYVTYSWNGVNGLASSDLMVDSPSGSNQVSIGFNNLIAGTDYTYSIVSVVDGHNAGDGGCSISVGGSFSTPALVSADSFRYENLGTNSVSVAWSFQNDSGWSATHSVTLDNGETSTNLTFNTDAGPCATNILFTVQGLVPGEYIVTVESFLNDADGYGEAAWPGYSISGIDILTVPDGPLITISGLHYENLTANSVDVVWNFTATNDYPATHVLYYSTGDPAVVNGPYLPFDYPDSGQVRITIGDFQPSSTNLVAVQSSLDYLSQYDPALTSAAGALTIVTPSAIAITSAPVRSAVSGSAGNYSTTLSWAFQNNTYDPVTHVVDYAWFTPDDSGTGEIVATSDPGDTSVSVTIPNLQPQATYVFAVNSGFADGDYIASFPAGTTGVFTTEDVTPSPGISIFNVSANPELIGDTSAVITWNVAYAGSNVFAPHNHFVVLSSNAPPRNLSQSVIATGLEDANNPSNVTAILTGLAPGQTNFFFVQSVADPFPGHFATDLNGGALYSFTNTASGAMDTNARSAITISQPPSTVFVTNTSALITWQVASSDDNPTNHTHFLVVSESATPASTNAVVTLSTEDDNGTVFAHVTGLWPGRTYYYYVQSFTDSGLVSADTDDNSGQFYSFTTDSTPVANPASIFGANGTGGVGGSGSGGSGGSGGWTANGGFNLTGTGSGQGGTGSTTNGLQKMDAKNTTANVTCFFDIGAGPQTNIEGSYEVRFSCQGAGEPYPLTVNAQRSDPGTNCSFKLTPGQEYTFSVETLSEPNNVGRVSENPKNVQIYWRVDNIQSLFDMGGGYVGNYLWKHADTQKHLWKNPIYIAGETNSPTTWTIAIPKADLVAMKVENGVEAGELSEDDEEKTGAFLPLHSSAADDPPLLPIKLKAIQPASMKGYYKIWMDTHLKIWKTKDRASTNDLVSATTTFEAKGDTTLYVEGVATGVATLGVDWHEKDYGPGETFGNLDRIKITVFEWKGPRNVPECSRHRYSTSGALPKGSWKAKENGNILGEDSSGWWVKWGTGPAVGRLTYVVNGNYSWDIDVNVIGVKIENPDAPGWNASAPYDVTSRFRAT